MVRRIADRKLLNVPMAEKAEVSGWLFWYGLPLHQRPK